MEFFESKKAILEYCGKDWKDIRWLERAIADDRVRICDGAYFLTSEYIENLENENGDLEEEVARLRKELNGGGNVQPVSESDDVSELRRKLEEAESNLEFQIAENEKCEARVKRYQDSIRNSFYYINDTLHKKVDWPTYKAVIKLEWDLPWEDNQ